jgi:hypothetical protein
VATCLPYEIGDARDLDLRFPFRAGDLFTCERIRDCYDHDRKGQPTSTKAVGASLRKVGGVATSLIYIEGRTQRPYAIRNPEKWANATPDALKAEFIQGNH